MARHIGVDRPATVTEDHLISWSDSRDWAPETRNSFRASARLFFRWWAPRNNADDPACLGAIRRVVPPPRPAPDSAINTALCNVAPRTELILRLGAELGLRAGEIAAVQLDNLQPVAEGWATLTIVGKGGNQRILPVPPGLLTVLRRFNPAPTGWLFPGQINGHLSARWVGKLVAEALPDGWTLHSLRHRFATTAYNEGGKDLLAIKTALGHQSIVTTQRYTTQR